MQGKLGYWDEGNDLRSFKEKCMDAVAALGHTDVSVPDTYILGYYPNVKSNPFQKMLYSQAFSHGIAAVAVRSLEDVRNLPQGLKMIIHFHWIHQIFAEVNTVEQAEKAVDTFLEEVRGLKAQGIIIVWTIHNVISHGARFEEQENRLRSVFSELVDHIHIMNPRTAALCDPNYTIDMQKVIEVPHPSYAGVYGNYISKAQARLDLNLAPTDAVFLLFGSMVPQKGTRHFLAEIDSLQEACNGKAKLMIAGKAKVGAFYEEVLQLAAGRTDIKLMTGHVDDQQVQNLFRAADVVVCPYVKGLNSGVIMTAASFGRPVVVPNFLKPVFKGAEEWAVGFDSADFQNCVPACARAYELSQTPTTENEMITWAKELSAQNVSMQFFEKLRGRL